MNTINEDAWIMQKAEEEANALVSAGRMSGFAVASEILNAEVSTTRVSFAKVVEIAHCD